MIVAQNWLVERRDDGVVLVRVPSTGTFGIELPDAVFSFAPAIPSTITGNGSSLSPRSRAATTYERTAINGLCGGLTASIAMGAWIIAGP